MAQRCDTGDLTGDRRCILYARNASFDIAEQLGYRYFIQLDDDYTMFRYRFNDKLNYWAIGHSPISSLDQVFEAMMGFYQDNEQITSIALSQGGDYIGGALSTFASQIRIKRKAMNSFFCDTERRFWFPGRLNEDVNAYTAGQRRGEIFFTLNQISLEQVPTQAGAGGMSDVYLDGGTYVKSFYSIMNCPSAVTMRMMGYRSYRVHHLVNDYHQIAPAVIRAEHRKPQPTTSP